MVAGLLLVSALGMLGAGLLTVRPAPSWVPWKFAVLAGECGHWLALVPLLLLGLLGSGVAGYEWPAGLAAGASAVALGLLLKPAVQASAVARTLPQRMRGAFGAAAVPRRTAFAAGRLWARTLAPGRVETMTFAEGLALDFYRAPGREGRPAPCVIAIHGGGWDSGDRGQLPALNHWLVRQGYAVAAISYRLAPQHRWPAPRDDVRAALAFLKANAARLDLDPTRLVLFGRSAGGQIAKAVGYTAGDPAIRGVMALYAPADLHFAWRFAREDDVLKSPQLMRQYLGGAPAAAAAAYDDASSIRFVDKTTPPTLLLHGRNDTLVWHRQSERLAVRLEDAGVAHVFVSLPWATHAFEANLHGPGGQLTTYAMEGFLAAVTK